MTATAEETHDGSGTSWSPVVPGVAGEALFKEGSSVSWAEVAGCLWPSSDPSWGSEGCPSAWLSAGLQTILTCASSILPFIHS